MKFSVKMAVRGIRRNKGRCRSGLAVTVITKLVEGGQIKAVVETLDGVIPISCVREYIIEDGRVPFVTRSKDDVGKSVPLVISMRHHGHIRHAINDVEGYDVAVIRANALGSSDFHRAVINAVVVHFKLPTRVNSAIVAVVSILSHDSNRGTMLGGNACSGVNYFKGVEGVVIDASNIDLTVMCMDDTCIVTEYPAVSSPINKRSACSARYVFGYAVNMFVRA